MGATSHIMCFNKRRDVTSVLIKNNDNGCGAYRKKKILDGRLKVYPISNLSFAFFQKHSCSCKFFVVFLLQILCLSKPDCSVALLIHADYMYSLDFF